MYNYALDVDVFVAKISKTNGIPSVNPTFNNNYNGNGANIYAAAVPATKPPKSTRTQI